MAKPEDLTGREFGFLKVREKAPDRVTPSGQKRKFWLCECICGTKKEISAQDLKRGSAISCGCYRGVVGKGKRNIKFCVVCGKPFECPPSDKTVTCSKECRRIHASKRQRGAKWSDESKQKLSASAKGRDMTDLQDLAVRAAMASPKSGKFVTNVHAKDWCLISPNGRYYRFHSLNFWLRENCRELFGCEPYSREYKNVRSGLSRAKRAVLGKISGDQRPCCTYKGWQVIPTEDDLDK